MRDLPPFYRQLMDDIGLVLMNKPADARLVRDAYTWRAIDPAEVWIASAQAWVRLDGNWVSGWRDTEHFAFRPPFLGRWRIRIAASVWLRFYGYE